MYFNKKNNFFHGIMFHHFHDGKTHKKSQGSISKNQLYKLINYIGKKNILDADIFLEKFKKKKLKNNEVCLTFDDAIKSQIDVALPIIEELKIKCFFFVYTSIFEGKPDYLEVYRYFRENFYNDINDFYYDFNKLLNKKSDNFLKKEILNIKRIKKKFPFYSFEDIKFRLLRDNFLNKRDYQMIMSKLMKNKNFVPKKFLKKLFFSKGDLIKLDKLGHIIGLHGHNHHTLIEKLPLREQKYEYAKCKNILSKILKKPKDKFNCMSHPCGSYNSKTLKILEKLKIELGFKQIMEIEANKNMKKINNSVFEVARQDHAVIIKTLLK